MRLAYYGGIAMEETYTSYGHYKMFFENGQNVVRLWDGYSNTDKIVCNGTYTECQTFIEQVDCDYREACLF